MTDLPETIEEIRIAVDTLEEVGEEGRRATGKHMTTSSWIRTENNWLSRAHTLLTTLDKACAERDALRLIVEDLADRYIGNKRPDYSVDVEVELVHRARRALGEEHP